MYLMDISQRYAPASSGSPKYQIHMCQTPCFVRSISRKKCWVPWLVDWLVEEVREAPPDADPLRSVDSSGSSDTKPRSGSNFIIVGAHFRSTPIIILESSQRISPLKTLPCAFTKWWWLKSYLVVIESLYLK